MDLESLRGKVVSGLFWLAVTKFAGQGISWVITLVVVRLLTPEDYGLMTMAVLVNSFLMLFNELGLGAAIIRKQDLTEHQLSDLRWVIFFVNLGLFGLLLATAPATGRYFGEPGIVPIVRVMALVFVINGLGAGSSFVLIRQMAFRRKAQAELVGNLAGGLSTLALASSGFGVWSLVGGNLVLQVITNGLYCLYAPLKLRWSVSFRAARHSLQFGSQVALGKVFWWISASADAMIVGRVLGTVQLGYYGLAVQFASLPLEKVVSLIGQVALPSFCAVQNDDDALRRYYLKLVRTVAFITFPMFFGMALVADLAVSVLLTAKWAPIVVPFQLLCIASSLRAIETLNTPLLVARGRPSISLFNSVLQSVVLSTAFYIGAQYGLTGVAIAWIVAWPVLYAIVTSQTLRVLHLSPWSYVHALRHTIAGSASMAVAVMLVRSVVVGQVQPVVSVVITTATGALVYLGYFWASDRDTVTEVLETLRLRKRSAPAAATAALADDPTSATAQQVS